MCRLKDNEEQVLELYDCLLTKEWKHGDVWIWRVYDQGVLMLATAIVTYALDHFAAYVRYRKMIK